MTPRRRITDTALVFGPFDMDEEHVRLHAFDNAVPCWSQRWEQVQHGRMDEAGFYLTFNRWTI